MSAIRVLIVDDEPAAREALRTLLGADAAVTVAGESRNGAEALAAIRTGGIDLVFLDVEMPDVNGLAVAQQIGDDPPVIVFVTAYDQYLLSAFDVHAVDYLLKPFTDERFYAALAHAKRMVHRAEGQRLTERLAALVATRNEAEHQRTDFLRRLPVRQGDRVTLVPIANVEWIEADGDYVRVHIGAEQFMLRETMSHLESQLDPAQFARIHRSTIVNLDRVREFRTLFKGDHDVVLQGGARLKLSRHFKDSLEQRLGRSL
jgi:two-component system LytT family response regulator